MDDVSSLLEQLKSSDWKTRHAAAVSLGNSGDPRAVAPLIAILTAGETNWPLFCIVAASLGKLGDPAAVEPLISVLEERNASRGEAAAMALGELADTRAVEPLLACLNHPHLRLGVPAAIAVGRLGQPAVGRLIECLKCSDLNTRLAAVRTFQELRNPRAVEPLIGCLNDPDCDVREHSAWALDEMGDRKAVEPLLACLNDTHLTVRKAAAWAVGKLRDGPPPEYSLVEKHEPLSFDIALLGCPSCEHRSQHPTTVRLSGSWGESRVSSEMEYRCEGMFTCSNCRAKFRAYFESRKHVSEGEVSSVRLAKLDKDGSPLNFYEIGHCSRCGNRWATWELSIRDETYSGCLGCR